MTLRRFALGASGSVRGALVLLEQPWQTILARRSVHAQGSYPPAVQTVLGELTAAALLMHSTIKFDGSLIVQLHGQGVMPLAVVEVQADFGLRTTAKLRGEAGAAGGLSDLMAPLHAARCVVTLEPQLRVPGQQPYQGVVPLDIAHPAEQPLKVQHVLQSYMAQSEQLDTTLVLAADDRRAGGLLVQRMPGHGGTASTAVRADGSADDGYERCRLLACTLRSDELLQLDADTLLRRLFLNEGLAELAPDSSSARTPHFACRCSAERVRGMVHKLGQEEAHSILAEQGQVLITCEFCFAEYRLDRAEVQGLFAAPSAV